MLADPRDRPNKERRLIAGRMIEGDPPAGSFLARVESTGYGQREIEWVENAALTTGDAEQPAAPNRDSAYVPAEFDAVDEGDLVLVFPQEGVSDKYLAVPAERPTPAWKTPPARARTTAALPTCTYANGAGGVGATLTATANGALPAQDGVTLAVRQSLLVMNQAAPLQNGIYTLTQVGTGALPFVLARRADADTGTELTGAVVTVVDGTRFKDSVWECNAASGGAIVVGTNSITWRRIDRERLYLEPVRAVIIGTGFSDVVVGASIGGTGGTLAAGDRVLLITPTDNASCGIVIVQPSGSAAFAQDWTTVNGAIVAVKEGTYYGSLWQASTGTTPDTVGGVDVAWRPLQRNMAAQGGDSVANQLYKTFDVYGSRAVPTGVTSPDDGELDGNYVRMTEGSEFGNYEFTGYSPGGVGSILQQTWTYTIPGGSGSSYTYEVSYENWRARWALTIDDTVGLESGGTSIDVRVGDLGGGSFGSFPGLYASITVGDGEYAFPADHNNLYIVNAGTISVATPLLTGGYSVKNGIYSTQYGQGPGSVVDKGIVCTKGLDYADVPLASGQAQFALPMGGPIGMVSAGWQWVTLAPGLSVVAGALSVNTDGIAGGDYP